MPDLQNFSIARNGTVSIASFPRFTITAQVCDSKTGAVITDLTGAAALDFPSCVKAMTTEHQLLFARMVAQWLVREKAGLLNEQGL
jgi:hypothetical protein